jgi:hypothetical protein
MWRAFEKSECIVYRNTNKFNPLDFVVDKINEKLELSDAKKAKDVKIAIKAYGCEFDNYLICRSEAEIDVELQLHRRDHLMFWDTEWSCQINVPFTNTEDDEEYDKRAKAYVKIAHMHLMDTRVILPQDCTVYHGLVGYRKIFSKPYRYLSTTTDLMMAYNFAGNEDLTDKVSPTERSEYEVVLKLHLPAGTECFSTNVCHCVQEEDEITLISNDELNIEVLYDKKMLVEAEFEYYGSRQFYMIPAVLKLK